MASHATSIDDARRYDAEHSRRVVWTFAALGALLLGVLVLACAKGAVALPVARIVTAARDAFAPDGSVEAAIVGARLPRVVLAMLVGAALGLAGSLTQGLFRNPLADPTLVGVSSGAALGAASAVVLGVSTPWVGRLVALTGLTAAAFVGAIVATFVVYRLGRFGGRTHIVALVLSGIVVNAVAMALVGLLVFFADDAQLRAITFWNLGSMGAANWRAVICVGVTLAASTASVPWFARHLDALALGESNAAALGAPVERVRLGVFAVVAAIVGASVAVTGIIGFVGLVVPHVMRMVVGARHAVLVPASMLGGAILLVLGDLVARTVVAPMELPLGVVTALAGGPVFGWLMKRRLHMGSGA